MVYFRKRKILIQSQEQTEKFLNQSTSKVLTMFDLTATSTYIILEERPFVGQKLANGETIISRYRHSLFKIIPRIITKWKIEVTDDELFLVVKNRLALLPTMALVIILFPSLVEIVKSALTFELPDFTTLSYSLVFVVLFIVLLKYELKQTDRTITKVIDNGKLKSLITI
jgi:hypothetical protein